MIFVTVGTHEQPFNRLVRKMDELKRDGRITEDVVIQTGFSTYEPRYCRWRKSFSYTEMQILTEKARIVVTHGGPSSFMMPIQMGKVPVVVPRKHNEGEHVNDHQIRFCEAVNERYHCILLVEDIDQLENVLTDYDRLSKEAENIPAAGNSHGLGLNISGTRASGSAGGKQGLYNNPVFVRKFTAIADELWEEKQREEAKRPSGRKAASSAGKNRPKICLVGSSGGHLMQLYLLKEYWEQHDRFWVTFDKPDARSLLEGEKMIPCYYPTNRSVKALGINTRLAWKVLHRERPDIIISAGAAAAVPFFTIGKSLGAKTIFMEVFDRIDAPTMTGKMVYPFTDRFIVQWESMKKVYKKAINLNSIYLQSVQDDTGGKDI